MLLCIVVILFLGFNTIFPQTANNKDANKLKPLVMVGSDILTLNQYYNNIFELQFVGNH